MINWTSILTVSLFLAFGCGSVRAQVEVGDAPGTALYGELIGKGIGSVNVDFAINDHHRWSLGITSLDYEVLNKEKEDQYDTYNWPSPGVMYYYLPGSGAHRWEFGAGLSISPVLNRTYDSDIHTDSPLSLHGVIGYRYQKKEAFFFRAGLTPFYRPKVWLLPLIGLSFGYSW
jgi:hypothetical protein